MASVRSLVDDPMPLGRRHSSRVRLHLPAQFVSLDGTHKCWLENLSISGARLLTPLPPRGGASGFLMFFGHEAFATVMWRNSYGCGIAFDDYLPLPVVIEMRSLSESYPELERRRHESSLRDWVQGRGRIVSG